MNFARFIRCYVQSIGEDELGFRAGALAYFATFSIFPLILLLVNVFSRIFVENEDLQRYLQASILEVMPVGAMGVWEVVEEILISWNGASVVALLGLLWAASGFFRGLEATTNRIFGAEQRRATLLSRGIGMIMAILVGPLIFLAVILSAFSQALLRSPFLPESLRPLLATTSNALVFGLILWLAFFLLYHFVPWKRPQLRATVLGSGAVALTWTLVTRGFIWYISSGWKDYSVIYGSISAIIVIFLWFYLSNFIILLGAELTAYLGGTKKCDPQPMAPLIEKALTAVRLPLESKSHSEPTEKQQSVSD
ncbi:MAG: YihY/virulence factor BrkB family protein [Caldilineales bacterium]|nr:YihY/virulence factor BrkB family protein [Caldilineales bacterium]